MKQLVWAKNVEQLSKVGFPLTYVRRVVEPKVFCLYFLWLGPSDAQQGITAFFFHIPVLEVCLKVVIAQVGSVQSLMWTKGTYHRIWANKPRQVIGMTVRMPFCAPINRLRGLGGFSGIRHLTSQEVHGHERQGHDRSWMERRLRCRGDEGGATQEVESGELCGGPQLD